MKSFYHGAVPHACDGADAGEGYRCQPAPAGEIETDEQAAFVASVRCDEGQGYRYGRPQRFDSLVSTLRASQRPKLRLVERTA